MGWVDGLSGASLGGREMSFGAGPPIVATATSSAESVEAGPSAVAHGSAAALVLRKVRHLSIMGSFVLYTAEV
jgi:hypothetical protein